MTYTAKQLHWASIVVDTARNHFGSNDVGERAADIALATCLVETNLKMYANHNVSESFNYPHEAVGSDHLSVGLFQQQTPMWGSCKDCMDPAKSAMKFFHRLESFDWKSMTNGAAAQRVQGSAFPDRYADRDAQAIALRKRLWGTSHAAPAKPAAPAKAPAKPTPSKPTAKPRPVYYVVKRGETLSGIAETMTKKYKTSITWQHLQTLNHIKDADEIEAGQKIRIK